MIDLIKDLQTNKGLKKILKISCQLKLLKKKVLENIIEELSKAIGKSNKAILGIEDINLSKEIQKINNGGEVIG